MTVVLGISFVRLVLELTNRLRYGMTGCQSPSVCRVMSTATKDQSRPIDGLESASGAQQLGVELATVDLHIDYPIYAPFIPRFVNVDDRRSFLRDPDNRVYLAASQLTGRVRVIADGVIRRDHECSWKTSDDEFSRLGGVSQERSTVTHVNKTLCPLLVPDGHTFQHFVDGVLPKLVQLLTEAPRLASAVNTFVVYQPRDAIIYELLERVGITRQRLMLITPETWQSSQVLEVRRVVDTCVTPSLHPQLWHRASQLLQSCQNPSNRHERRQTMRCLYNESLRKTAQFDSDSQPRTLGENVQRRVGSKITNASTANSSLIVLLSRRWTRNGGRRLLNEYAVFEYLVGRFGLQRVVRFGNGRVDLTTANSLFSRAAAVVGVHGGAFYNIILAPAGCIVVELMPLVAHRGQVAAPPRRLAHTIVWRMADALGHTYWRLYAVTSSPRGDVTLSIDKLRSALTDVT